MWFVVKKWFLNVIKGKIVRIVNLYPTYQRGNGATEGDFLDYPLLSPLYIKGRCKITVKGQPKADILALDRKNK